MPFLGIRTAIWSVFGRQHKSSHISISWMPNFIFCYHLGWSMHWGEKNGGWQFGGSRQDREKWKLHDLIRCPRLKTFIPPWPCALQRQLSVHCAPARVKFKSQKIHVFLQEYQENTNRLMRPCADKKDQQCNAMDVCGVRSAFYEKNTVPVCIVRCSGMM